jgi:hypothetical protein
MIGTGYKMSNIRNRSIMQDTGFAGRELLHLFLANFDIGSSSIP